jgi:hypothetical protein
MTFAGSIFLLAILLPGCGSDNNKGDGGAAKQSITGRLVRANDSQPLQNASVRLSGTRADPPADFITNTDASGNYRFSEIPVGDYTLEARMADGSYQPIQLPVKVLQQEPTEVPPLALIPSGVTLGRIEIVLPPKDGPNNSYRLNGQYTFTARVLNATGAELSGWRPNWRIEGTIGVITSEGVFSANAAGDGQVAAFFYVGAQEVVFRSPISVRDAVLGDAPKLLVAGNVPGGYGVNFYNSRTGLLESSKKFTTSGIYGNLAYDRTRDLLYYADAKTVYQYNMRSGAVVSRSLTETNVEGNITSLLVMPDGNLLVANIKGFHLLKYQNLETLRAGMQYHVFESVDDMKVGPDNNLYVVGDAHSTFAQNANSVIIRFTIGEGNSLESPAVLWKDGNGGQTSNIVFTRNGHMLVSAHVGDTIRRFNGQSFEAGITVPNLVEAITLGQNVLKDQDEVIFAHTTSGIRRISYSNGAYKLETDKDPIVKQSSIEDLLIVQPQ